MHLDIPLDYAKSVVDVYTDYAKAMLKPHNLEILSDAGIWNRREDTADSNLILPTRKTDSLASWVPEHRISNLATRDPIPWSPAIMHPQWGYCWPVITWPKCPVYKNRVFVEGVVLGSL